MAEISYRRRTRMSNHSREAEALEMVEIISDSNTSSQQKFPLCPPNPCPWIYSNVKPHPAN